MREQESNTTEMEVRWDVHIRVRLPLRHSGMTVNSVNRMNAGDVSNVTVDVVLNFVMSDDGNTLNEGGKEVGKG